MSFFENLYSIPLREMSINIERKNKKDSYLTKIKTFCRIIAAPGQFVCSNSFSLNQCCIAIQIDAITPEKQIVNETKSHILALL